MSVSNMLDESMDNTNLAAEPLDHPVLIRSRELPHHLDDILTLLNIGQLSKSGIDGQYKPGREPPRALSPDPGVGELPD